MIINIELLSARGPSVEGQISCVLTLSRHETITYRCELTLIALCVPAAGADHKVTGQLGHYGVGHATEIEKHHLYWTGEFSGTFFNDKGPNSDHPGVRSFRIQ